MKVGVKGRDFVKKSPILGLNLRDFHIQNGYNNENEDENENFFWRKTNYEGRRRERKRWWTQIIVMDVIIMVIMAIRV